MSSRLTLSSEKRGRFQLLIHLFDKFLAMASDMQHVPLNRLDFPTNKHITRFPRAGFFAAPQEGHERGLRLLDWCSSSNKSRARNMCTTSATPSCHSLTQELTFIVPQRTHQKAAPVSNSFGSRLSTSETPEPKLVEGRANWQTQIWVFLFRGSACLRGVKGTPKGKPTICPFLRVP